MKKGRFAIIPARAIGDRQLPRGALLVLCAVALHGDSDGWCWPSQSLLADIAGISRQMVGRYLGQLQLLGYIERRRRLRSDGGRTSDQIRILFDLGGYPETSEVAPLETSEVAPPETSEVAAPETLEVAQTDQTNKLIKQTIRTGKTLQIPDWLPQDAWSAFLEMRQKIKAPLTNRAIQSIWAELQRLQAQGNDVEQVLMRSVTSSWRFVYPLAGQKTTKNAQALAEFNRRLIEQEGRG